MAFPSLQSDRLVYRQFQAEDLELVFYGLSHPEVIRYYGVSYDSLEATKEQLAWFKNLEETKTGLWWAICRKEDGVFVGAGGFNDWSHEHQKAEVGFWLLPEHWGKGYLQEGMPTICQYAFERMNLHRIEGFVVDDNQNCRKAIEKVGYKYEGTMRDCEVKDGKFISVAIYALIR